MKIGVLFNCQHEGLRVSLQALRPDDEVVSFGIPGLASSAALRNEAMRVLSACDAMIFKPGPNAIPADELRRMRSSCGRAIAVPAPAFAGYHPDTIYINTATGNLHGPTVAIHSRIAVAAFLGGLTPAQTIPLFSRLAFARLGYPARFASDHALMAGHFATHGIELGATLLNWHAQGCFMHSVNHPKAIVMLDMARLACRKLDLAVTADVALPPDTLAHTPCHPVYPDLADMLGVARETAFRAAANMGPAGDWEPARTMDTEVFLDTCFAQYASVQRHDLLAAKGVAHAMHRLGFAT
jgi:hypothetical protein